ncbi:FHA domain-containing protein [Marivita sp. S0852]|uniref:FHA domain-containing protein n=1 Tax=Marivita sp. S0852 TaxID=3373893 RepID=UPI0039822F67
MAQPSDTLLLKILGGAQFGAEVALEPGTYSFGSGDGCDLVFADALLAEAHGSVRLGEGRIEIRAESGALQTAAGLSLEPDNEAWHEIAQLDTITAGTTRFAIGTRGANWSRLETAAGRGDAPPPPESTGRSRRQLIMPIGLAALVVFFIIGSALFSSEGASSRIAEFVGTARLSDEARVARALEDLPFAHDIKVSVADDGRVSVRGYVENVAQRRAVRQVLSATESAVAPNISVIEVMENDIRGLVRARGLDLQSRVATGGIVTLSGNELSDSAVSDLADTILTQVLGVTAVRDEVRSASDILAEAQDMLEAARLDGPVILRLTDGLAEATGVVPSSKVDNWVGFVSGYASRYAADVPLRSFVALEGRGAPQPIVIAAGQSVSPDLGTALGPAPNESDILDALTTGPVALAAATQDSAPVQPAPAPESIAAALAPFRVAFDADPDAMLDRLGLPAGTLSANRVLALLDLAEADPQAAAAAFEQLPQNLQKTLRSVLGEVQKSETVAQTGQPDALRDTTQPGTGAASPVWSSLLSFAMGNPAAELEAAASALVPTDRETGEIEPPTFPAGPAADSQPNTQGDPLLRNLSQILNGTPPPDTDISTESSPPYGLLSPDPKPNTSGFGASQPGMSQTGTSERFTRPLPASVTTFDAPFRRLIQATDLVLADDSVTVKTAGPGIRRALSTLSQTLVSTVRDQQEALAQGRTILPAQAVQSSSAEACWPGAPITPAQIPTVLFWLDYFSVDANADLAQLDGPNQRVMLEAALSPRRLRACLERLDHPTADTLIEESIFLQEMSVNNRFGGFLLRNVPQVELDLAGIDFTGTRYIELRDGRRLEIGSAPDLESRIAAIGDFGVLLREPGRFAARLFGPDIGWQINEF